MVEDQGRHANNWGPGKLGFHREQCEQHAKHLRTHRTFGDQHQQAFPLRGPREVTKWHVQVEKH